jgi:excisionase family DNA binding protein
MSEMRVLTVEQVADRVQLSSKTVMRAIHAGDLEASQLTRGRGGWRIYETAISDWLERRSNRQRATSVPDVRAIEPAGLPRRPPRRASARSTSGRLVA